MNNLSGLCCTSDSMSANLLDIRICWDDNWLLRLDEKLFSSKLWKVNIRLNIKWICLRIFVAHHIQCLQIVLGIEIIEMVSISLSYFLWASSEYPIIKWELWSAHSLFLIAYASFCLPHILDLVGSTLYVPMIVSWIRTKWSPNRRQCHEIFCILFMWR